ncbi:MAG: hypothetical protein KBB83_04870 [Alphaproteobacteria bacterium]|nr:hypothetical protein [Alphaproteobacteria bacterium]
MRFCLSVLLSLFLCVPVFAKKKDMDMKPLLVDKFRSLSILGDQLSDFMASHPLLGKIDHRELREPFILLDDDEPGIRVSTFLKQEQETLLRMNELSYKLIRDADSQIKLALDEMQLLRQAEWEIYPFSGREGRWNTYPDLSGLVLYHAKYNLIIVVYRGTAGNKDGWDTNFDATRTKAKKVQKEFCRDLLDELASIIRNSPQAKSLKELKTIVRNAQETKPSYKNAQATAEKITSYLKNNAIEESDRDALLKAIAIKMEIMDAVDKLGCNIEGQTHKGFLKKYLSTKREVLDILKSITQKMSKKQKYDLKIVFTGHSQAGGTGNIAMADICANHGKEIFGSDFRNDEDFHFYGYFLSAARIGDKVYKKWVHDHVGKPFIIRQNVEGDPTPVSSGDKKIGQFLHTIPVVGELLAKNISHYDDTGYLLLDNGHQVWKRAKILYEQEGYDMDSFAETEDTVRYIASWVLMDESAVPKFLAPKQDNTSFFWSPIKWVKNRIRAAKIANLIRQALTGDQDATKELTDLSEVILTRYAHLHYGHYYKDIGAVFSQTIVGRDLDKMALEGYINNHEDTE